MGRVIRNLRVFAVDREVSQKFACSFQNFTRDKKNYFGYKMVGISLKKKKRNKDMVKRLGT